MLEKEVEMNLCYWFTVILWSDMSQTLISFAEHNVTTTNKKMVGFFFKYAAFVQPTPVPAPHFFTPFLLFLANSVI